MRVRSLTRVGAALTLALTFLTLSAASAGAISLAGIEVPGTQGIQVPQVPDVALPGSDVPGPVGGAVQTVNGVTHEVGQTVNGAVGSATGTAGGAAGSAGQAVG